MARSSNASTQQKRVGFGGVPGVTAIILLSHFLLIFVNYVIFLNGGNIFPLNIGDMFSKRTLNLFLPESAVLLKAATIYFGFIAAQAVLAITMPGVEIIVQTKSKPLRYLCNSYACFVVTFSTLIGSWLGGYINCTELLQYIPPITLISAIFSDLHALFWYAYARLTNQVSQDCGSRLEDFFEGIYLHPRIFFDKLDIKLFAEVRISWYLLLSIVLIAAGARYERVGQLDDGFKLHIFAISLYVFSMAKGEAFVPPCFDIQKESWGFLLCFWNFTGVPLVYSSGALWTSLHSTHPLPSDVVRYTLLPILLLAYYIFDTANSQKAYFSLSRGGSTLPPPRWGIPKLPYQYIEKPATLRTKNGRNLLIDGWYQYARKPHYTADIIMSSIWGISCGFSALIPYLYPAFFLCMIIHRQIRDDSKCAIQYGDDWKEYKKRVPYTFIPGVI